MSYECHIGFWSYNVLDLCVFPASANLFQICDTVRKWGRKAFLPVPHLAACAGGEGEGLAALERRLRGGPWRGVFSYIGAACYIHGAISWPGLGRVTPCFGFGTMSADALCQLNPRDSGRGGAELAGQVGITRACPSTTFGGPAGACAPSSSPPFRGGIRPPSPPVLRAVPQPGRRGCGRRVWLRRGHGRRVGRGRASRRHWSPDLRRRRG